MSSTKVSHWSAGNARLKNRARIETSGGKPPEPEVFSNARLKNRARIETMQMLLQAKANMR